MGISVVIVQVITMLVLMFVIEPLLHIKAKLQVYRKSVWYYILAFAIPVVILLFIALIDSTLCGNEIVIGVLVGFSSFFIIPSELKK